MSTFNEVALKKVERRATDMPALLSQEIARRLKEGVIPSDSPLAAATRDADSREASVQSAGPPPTEVDPAVARDAERPHVSEHSPPASSTVAQPSVGAEPKANRPAAAQATRSRAELASLDDADGFVGNPKEHLDPSEVISKLLDGMSHRTQKDGSVVYMLDDRDVLVDHGQQLIMVDKANEDERAILGAILLAKEKFGGSFELTGSEAFQRRAIEVMLKYNVDVKLKHPAQHALRLEIESKHTAAQATKALLGIPAKTGGEDSKCPTESPSATPSPREPLAADLIAVRAIDWWVAQRAAIQVWAKGDHELKADLEQLGPQPPSDLIYWFDKAGEPCDPPADADGHVVRVKRELPGILSGMDSQASMEEIMSDKEIGKTFRDGLAQLADGLEKDPSKIDEYHVVVELLDEMSDIHNQLFNNGGDASDVEGAIGERIRLGTGFAARDLPTSVKELMKTSVESKEAPKLILRGVRRLDNGEFDTTALLFKGKGDYLQGFIKVGDEKRQVLAHIGERMPDPETGVTKPNYLKLVTPIGEGDDITWSTIGHGNAVNRRADNKEVFFDEVLFNVDNQIIKTKLTKNVDDTLHKRLGFVEARKERPKFDGSGQSAPREPAATSASEKPADPAPKEGDTSTTARAEKSPKPAAGAPKAAPAPAAAGDSNEPEKAKRSRKPRAK
ncbi:hypothetical protein BDI4_660043 [Burkholderia diffusa]|uniref:LPD7 domain-containing protein n=1 Tax=Burkholderia diffusa TaxID=488732 RepID=UPI001CB06763|nr:LPD7 domain-containing protein [Burkholderia diffusa]CAG9260978.1 hypothetical protein BDI4_660043 [Burkholderia diffusa]